MNAQSHGIEAQAAISPAEFEEGEMQRRNEGSIVVVGSSQSETTSSAAAPTAGRTQLRECCDFCTTRKRKCDGDGANPCSFCIAKKRPHCHYSLRLPLGPRPDPSSSMNEKAEKRASKGSEAGGSTRHAPLARGIVAGGGGGGGVVRRKATSQRVDYQTLTLKRTRFGPSPATGLVGTRENDYLGDFFRILGFLPLATQSAVRKAMVETIFAARNDWPNPNASPAVGGSTRSAVLHVTRMPLEVVNLAASTCTLWSTIALGALVEGRPTGLVESYLRLARQSLAHCFDSESVEIARAFTSLALVYGFTGDEVKSRKNLRFAGEIIEALPRDQVTEDLFDCLCFLKLNGMFACTRDAYRLRCGEKRQQENFEDGARHFPKVPRVYHQSNLCRLIIETEENISRVFFDDMAKHDVFDEEEATTFAASSEFIPAEGDETYGVAGSAIAADDRSQDREHAIGGTPRRTRSWKFQHGEWVPPPPGERSVRFAEEMSREFELLEDAFNSLGVKDGAGPLLFDSISSYLNGLCGKLEKASEKFLRTCRILESHPGLMRYGFWEHLAHCVLGVLSRSPEPDGYESMRAAFNSVRDEPGATLAPPFEEWRSMQDLCDRVFCRSTYAHLFTTKLSDLDVSRYIKDVSLEISQDIDHEAKVVPPSGADSAKVFTSAREAFFPPPPITDARKRGLPLPADNPGVPNVPFNELGITPSVAESSEHDFLNSAPKSVDQQGKNKEALPPQELSTRDMDKLSPCSIGLDLTSTATRHTMPSGYGSQGGCKIRTSDGTSARQQPAIHDDEREGESTQGGFSNTPANKTHVGNVAFIAEAPPSVLEKIMGDVGSSHEEHRLDDLRGIIAASTPSSVHGGAANNKLPGVEGTPQQQGSYADDAGRCLLQHARTDQSRHGCYSYHDDAGTTTPAGGTEGCQRRKANEQCIPDAGSFIDTMGGGGMLEKLLLEDGLDGINGLFPSLHEALEHFGQSSSS